VKSTSNGAFHNMLIRDNRRHMPVLFISKPEEEAATSATLTISELDFDTHGAVRDLFRRSELRRHGKS
jgi:hypothetical protein